MFAAGSDFRGSGYESGDGRAGGFWSSTSELLVTVEGRGIGAGASDWSAMTDRI